MALSLTAGDVDRPRISEFARYRDLLLSLAWRDIRVRYKQSLLGIGWAVLLPVSMMLVFTFVFTRAIPVASITPASDTPYALYAYCGLVPWTFFAMSLSGCVNSLVANRNLVTKVYFPREVFPFSCILSSFVDFCVALTVVFGLGIYFHVTTDWQFTLSRAMLFFPLIVVVQILLTMGIGMMLAMANLFYRDVRQVFSVGIQLLMFVSAVVIPVPNDGSLLANILPLNPVVPLMGAYRSCLLEGSLPDAGGFAYAAIASITSLLVGWMVFKRASRRFAECI